LAPRTPARTPLASEDSAHPFGCAGRHGLGQVLGTTALILDHVSGEDMKRADGRPLRKAIGSTMKGAWARAV
jgi:hypothetical protein